MNYFVDFEASPLFLAKLLKEGGIKYARKTIRQTTHSKHVKPQ